MGDLFLLSPAMYIAGKYKSQWKHKQILVMLAVGLAISTAMGWVYVHGKFPDSLMGGGRGISPAGWIHQLYFVGAIAMFGLFWFCSRPTLRDATLIWILLMAHIIVANHVVLKFLNDRYHFPWCPDIFTEETSPLRIIVGGSLALLSVTFYALRPQVR